MPSTPDGGGTATTANPDGNKNTGGGGRGQKRKNAASAVPAAVVQKLLDYAVQFRGTPYLWGGTSPQGFDCSGLVQYVYGHFGVDLPRISSEQARAGKPIDAEHARPGDLVYFDTGDRNVGADHIGIYLGHGMMLAAPHTGAQVDIQAVGNATGFDRVLPAGSWQGMRRSADGTPVYHPPTGVKIEQAPMNVTGSGGGGGGTGPDRNKKFDKKAFQVEYGYAASLFNAVPELKHLLTKAVANGWTGVQMAAAIQNSDWYQRHTQAQLDFFKLKPADQDRAVSQEAFRLGNQAKAMGLDLDQDQIQHLAHMVIRNGLQPDEVQALLAGKLQGHNYGGDAGAIQDGLMATASDFGLNISNKTTSNWTRRILTGSADQNAWLDHVKEIAKSAFPAMTKQLDQGRTVREVAEPYVQSYAQTLELDPAGIDITRDHLLRQAFGQQNAPGEDPTLMPIWQFEQKLRNDPRWLQTDNAMKTGTDETLGALRDLGLIA